MQVSKVKLVFARCLVLFLIALTVVLRHALFQAPVQILLCSHLQRRSQIAGSSAQRHSVLVCRQETTHLHIALLGAVSLTLSLVGICGFRILVLLPVIRQLLGINHGSTYIVRAVLLIVCDVGFQVVRVLQVRRAVTDIIGRLCCRTPDREFGFALDNRVHHGLPVCIRARNKKRCTIGHNKSGDKQPDACYRHKTQYASLSAHVIDNAAQPAFIVFRGILMPVLSPFRQVHPDYPVGLPARPCL